MCDSEVMQFVVLWQEINFLGNYAYFANTANRPITKTFGKFYGPHT